jgi:hypothetical protein
MNSNYKIVFIREHFLNNWTEDLTRNVDRWHPHRKCLKKMLSNQTREIQTHMGNFRITSFSQSINREHFHEKALTKGMTIEHALTAADGTRRIVFASMGM